MVVADDKLSGGMMMKLEAKLGSAYGILILAMFATSTAAYRHMAEVNRLTTMLIAERIPVVNKDREARVTMEKSARALEDFLFYRTDHVAAENYRKEYHAMKKFSESQVAELVNLSKQYDLGPDKARIPVIDAQMKELTEIEDRIEFLIASQKPEDTAAAYDLVKGQMASEERVFYTSMYDLVTSQKLVIESESQQVLDTTRSMMWTLWIATLVSTIIGGLVATTISRRISRSVHAVVERAASIAQGDLTGPPLAINSSDEVGMLAGAMHLMQTNLRQTIGAVARTASGVTGIALSIGSAGEEVHRKMYEQNQQTEQTASAVQEMSATVAEVSRHAGSAAKNARAAAETARHGGDIVREMLAGMNSIAKAVSSTSSTIHLLGEDSGRISRIVSVIEEIARQTNLLALNAAIEAARAGEQGRGFAVVAGEVRRLAESTAAATNEISEMIRGIQNRTGVAVASMAEGTATVEAGMATTRRAGEALEHIIGMAESVDKMIAQIAVAAVQQTSTASDSSAALHCIYQLGSENLIAMTSSVASAGSLRNSAVDLERQIERFQIADGHRADLSSRMNHLNLSTPPLRVSQAEVAKLADALA
jgi:methyl-accepting chemotaxis protein